MDAHDHACLHALREGRPTVWTRAQVSGAAALPSVISPAEVEAAAARLERFAPVLATLFAQSGWDGRIRSALTDFPAARGLPACLVKGDHALPVTGSIKARGGLHEVLRLVEEIASTHGLPDADSPGLALTQAPARRVLAGYRVVVASTGNLGYSVGLAARGFGLQAEVHMSREAKAWKKARLRDLGVEVVEHACDYSETIVRARASAAAQAHARFIDDEASRGLFTGYACAAHELADQLQAREITIGPDRPLVVYLPCGVGGAPGGVTYGLKSIFGADVISVFVEPVASACVLAALATGAACPPTVYEAGMDNRTLADGLAVPRASAFVLEAVGPAIDAVAAVDDAAMVAWVQQAWRTAGLRLEPSAASAFAAVEPFRRAAEVRGWPALDRAVHVLWATGGSRLPEAEFQALLEM